MDRLLDSERWWFPSLADEHDPELFYSGQLTVNVWLFDVF